MIKEVISNTFTINVNKQSEIPPTTQTKEVVSNTFNLIINKGEVIPPEQLESLESALKDYTAKLEHIRKCIQIANEKISKNVFDFCPVIGDLNPNIAFTSLPSLIEYISPST